MTDPATAPNTPVLDALQAGAEVLASNAPASAHEQFGILQQSMLLLAAGALVGPICRRLNLSPVIGYLLTGLALGPAGLVLLSGYFPPLQWLALNTNNTVHMLAEMGVVFLLFMIGLELSPKKLWQLKRLVFGLGSLQIGLCGALIGAVAYAWGNTAEAAVILGGSLAFSSTAIVMQLLAEQHRLGTSVGRGSFAVLLMQDLAVVPMLILLGLFSAGSGGSLGSLVGMAFLKAMVVLVALYLIGRWVLRPLLRFTSSSAGTEPFLAAALLAVVGTAALTGAAGLSMALGAFLAGLLLADSEYSTALEVYLEPFKGLLLGLFFLSVGMGMDVRAVQQQFVMLLLAVGGLVLLKGAIIFALARIYQFRAPRALEIALLLAGAGEFAFVLIGAAITARVVPAPTGQFMLLVTGLSMLLTPVLASLARRVAPKLETAIAVPDEAQQLPNELYGHIIIAGFGRVGRLLADVLRAHDVPYIGIEQDGKLVSEARQDGYPVFIGNVCHPDFLAKAGAGNAQAIVLSMRTEAQVAQALHVLKQHHKTLAVYARAPDFVAATRMLALGATDVTPETVEAGLQLAAHVLRGLGSDDDVIAQRLAMQRLRMREALELPLG